MTENENGIDNNDVELVIITGYVWRGEDSCHAKF